MMSNLLKVNLMPTWNKIFGPYKQVRGNGIGPEGFWTLVLAAPDLSLQAQGSQLLRI